MNNETACEAKIPQKHIDLHQAIQYIDKVTDRLDALINRMEGSIPINKEASAIEHDPNFMEVLIDGADRIRGKVDLANTRIDKLFDLLF